MRKRNNPAPCKKIEGSEGSEPFLFWLEFLPKFNVLVHDLKNHARTLFASEFSRAIEIAGRIQNQISGGMVPVAGFSEVMDYLVDPRTSGNGRQLEERTASSTASRHGSAEHCSSIEIPGGVNDHSSHGTSCRSILENVECAFVPSAG